MGSHIARGSLRVDGALRLARLEEECYASYVLFEEWGSARHGCSARRGFSDFVWVDVTSSVGNSIMMRMTCESLHVNGV